jgi:hypothetical protein
MVNTYSGITRKVFTLNRNGCSRSPRIGVHVEPEWVFMMGRNMQLAKLIEIPDDVYDLAGMLIDDMAAEHTHMKTYEFVDLCLNLARVRT